MGRARAWAHAGGTDGGVDLCGQGCGSSTVSGNCVKLVLRGDKLLNVPELRGAGVEEGPGSCCRPAVQAPRSLGLVAQAGRAMAPRTCASETSQEV